MATVTSLASAVVGRVQRGEALNARANDLAQRQAAFSAGTAPRNVTAQSLARENRNLSHAQFRHRLDAARTASEATSAVGSTIQNRLGGAEAPPKAVGPGLYS